MKKIGLTLVAVAMTIGLMAQLPHFGFRIGMTTSKLSSNAEDLLESKNRLGYQLGAFARVNLGKIYVQPELIYNHRSTKLDMVKQNVGFDGASATFKVGSFDIPILLGMKVLDLKVAHIRAFVGPNISFTTNKDVTLKIGGKKIEGETISTKDFKNKTWYLQAGVGVDFLNLTFDIRYEKGLSNIYSGKWEGFKKDSLDFKNNVWIFTLGFKIM